MRLVQVSGTRICDTCGKEREDVGPWQGQYYCSDCFEEEKIRRLAEYNTVINDIDVTNKYRVTGESSRIRELQDMDQ